AGRARAPGRRARGGAARLPPGCSHRPESLASSTPMLAVTAARHAWLVLALAVALGPAASAPPAPAPVSAAPAGLYKPGVRDAAHPGRWVREFERRRAILRGDSGPSAILALLGLVFELHGEVP